jgi:uncharacterized membrane protein
MAALTNLMASWGSIFANHAAVRTIVAFVHVGALIAGGGLAVSTDRSLLRARRTDEWSRRTLLDALHDAHGLVIGSLALIVASGVLLFAADYGTYFYSRFFWIKMGLVALLTINGAVLWRAERQALAGDQAAWRTLHVAAVASITLWFLITLGGVALPNIG